MKKISAILVDDEKRARDVLENLLHRFCPNVELLARCSDLKEAVKSIEDLKPDLVFLDIELPDYAGYEIAGFFEKINFKIVFVTAYEHYAIRAFEVAAIDYLLKPIDIARLKSAMSRVEEQINAEHQAQQLHVLRETLETKKVSTIIVSDKGHQHIVPVSDIIAIEAQEAYCQIHTVSRKFIASKHLKHFETLLGHLPEFIRTHKSWIINRFFLEHYSKSDFTISMRGGIQARLSKYKKVDFEATLNDHSA